MIRVLRQYHKTLSVISPKLAAKSAFEIFKTVRKKEIRDREKPFYLEAKQENLEIDGDTIHTYSFGNQDHDIVLLLHGWDSNAGCMYRFVKPLLAKNKYVVSFNLPGHAFYNSSKTNLFEAKETFKKFMSTLPDNRNISIISHSFGSAVAGYGLSELDVRINQLMFLTSPNKMEDIFDDYKKIIGLNKKSYLILKEKAQHILGERVEDLTIGDKLLKADFSHLHLFHDEFDKVLPYSNSLKIKSQVENSTLHTYAKIGHYRMLWNDELVKQVVAEVD